MNSMNFYMTVDNLIKILTRKSFSFSQIKLKLREEKERRHHGKLKLDIYLPSKFFSILIQNTIN